MKFTLLFYTDSWTTGPTIELSHVPAPGSLVWAAPRRRGEEDGAMYYVDNVMYPERGVDDEEVVYLYVRPYTGYAQYAPMTEADRLAEKLGAIAERLERVEGRIAAIAADRAVPDAVSRLCEIVARRRQEAASTGEAVLRFTDAIEDGQQRAADQLADAIALLEQIKDQL